MKLFGIRTLFLTLVGFVSFAVHLIVDVFLEVFPPDTAHPANLTDTANTELADRMSQTGNGVWAFVTNLFKVEGRTYTWQAGTIG